jgi:hypothetical protein
MPASNWIALNTLLRLKQFISESPLRKNRFKLNPTCNTPAMLPTTQRLQTLGGLHASLEAFSVKVEPAPLNAARYGAG